MRRKILYVTFFFLIAAGIGSCYLFNFYEYKSVFILPELQKSRIELTDSLFINPKLNIETFVGENRNQVMAAYIDFDKFSDSIVVKSLNVHISCTDNPNQFIYMTHVITYVDPLRPEYIDYVSAKKFDALPQHYKTVSLKRRPWNTYQLYFETKNIDWGSIYNFQISGSVLYRGQLLNFKKDVVAKRKKRFVRIQMMT